jgi:hypothetical protein
MVCAPAVPEGILRDKRRTSAITITGPDGHADEVRVCWPDCRNDVLRDLGVPTTRGIWVYPPVARRR